MTPNQQKLFKTLPSKTTAFDAPKYWEELCQLPDVICEKLVDLAIALRCNFLSAEMAKMKLNQLSKLSQKEIIEMYQKELLSELFNAPKTAIYSPNESRIQISFYSAQEAEKVEAELRKLMQSLDQDGWHLVVEDWIGGYTDFRPAVHLWLDTVIKPHYIVEFVKTISDRFSGVIHILNDDSLLESTFNHNDPEVETETQWVQLSQISLEELKKELEEE